MINRKNGEEQLREAILDIIHDLVTPLVAIKSGLNCTNDVYQKLVDVYLAPSLVKDLSESTLEKTGMLIKNALSEIVVVNYYVNKLRDLLKIDTRQTNKNSEMNLYHSLSNLIKHHVLINDHHREKIFIDQQLNQINIRTDKEAFEKAILYLFDDYFRVLNKLCQSHISIKQTNNPNKVIWGCFYNQKLSEKDRVAGFADRIGLAYFYNFATRFGWKPEYRHTESFFGIEVEFDEDGVKDEHQ